jgi:hypothetical protein
MKQLNHPQLLARFALVSYGHGSNLAIILYSLINIVCKVLMVGGGGVKTVSKRDIFNYTGAVQTWVKPTGVSEVTPKHKQLLLILQ